MRVRASTTDNDATSSATPPGVSILGDNWLTPPTANGTTANNTGGAAGSAAALKTAAPATPAAPAAPANIGAPNPTYTASVNDSAVGQAMSDLAEFGLTPDMQKQAINWYTTELNAGTTAAQMQVNMYQQPWFQTAFPGIVQQIKNGQSPMSPQDYVTFKQGVLDFNRQFGVPEGTVSDADIANMVGKGWTFKDYTDRMGVAFNDSAEAIANNPQAVAELDKWYGLKPGSGGLAAFMLDPSRSQALLAQAATAAAAGASAQQAGFTKLDQATLMGLAANHSLSALQSGISAAVPLLPTTRGTLGPGKSQATASEADLLASQVGGVPGGPTQEKGIEAENVAAGARVQALGGGGGGVDQGQPNQPTGSGSGTQ